MHPVEYMKLFHNVRNSKELSNVQKEFCTERRIAKDNFRQRRYFTWKVMLDDSKGSSLKKGKLHEMEGNDQRSSKFEGPARTMRKTIKQTFEGAGVTTRRGKFYTRGRNDFSSFHLAPWWSLQLERMLNEHPLVAFYGLQS